MLEIIGAIIGFGFLLFLMVYSFRMMEKEKKEIAIYRENFVNALNNIANAIKGIE